MEIRRYRAYITDCLKIITENTARAVPEGKYLQERWIEKYLPQDNRTGDEIAADVIKRLGLKVGGEKQ